MLFYVLYYVLPVYMYMYVRSKAKEVMIHV